MHDLNTIIKQNRSNAKKLIDATIILGGVSFDAKLNKLSLNFGYTVSMYTILKTKHTEDIEKALNGLNEYEGSFYGLWLHNDVFYLDSNLNVSSKKLALALGELTKQICIWDCKEGKEIEVN